jgi:hypothetical protein
MMRGKIGLFSAILRLFAARVAKAPSSQRGAPGIIDPDESFFSAVFFPGLA